MINNPEQYQYIITKRYRLYYSFLWLSVMTIIIFLHVLSTPFLPKLDFILVLSFMIYLRFVKNENDYYKNKFVKTVQYIFIFLSLWNILSVLYGKYFTNYPTSIADLALSVVYIFMLIYFLFGFILGSKNKYINLLFIIRVFSVLIAIIVLLEYFIPEFSHQIKIFYKIYEKTDYISNPMRYRVTGPFDNSNSLAVIASLFLFLNLFSEGKGFIKVIIVIALTFTIILSGSRTGFGLLFFIATYYFAILGAFRNFLIILGIFTGLMIIDFYVLDFQSSYLQRRLEVTSIDYLFYNRQKLYWGPSWKIFLESPVCGVGSLRYGLSTTDNLYLDILKTNGIVGLAFWLLFIGNLFWLSIKRYRVSKDAKIILGIIGIILLSSVTGDFFYSRVFYTISFMFLGFYSYKVISV